jgi:oxygen-independent coproporphyrinogen-3 oxidase
MAGVYVHIPYCIQACSYCDFHFTIYFGRIKQTIDAIILEADQKRDYLKDEIIETIYFGGGTPSAVPEDAIRQILIKIKNLYPINSHPEITLEANPDDITTSKIYNYQQMGINRLSIGVQSFNDDDLRLLNRRHSGKDAQTAVTNAIKGGFSNISIDLIYGIPGLKLVSWIENLEKAFNLGISHLSAYHLTYEPGTELYYRLQRNKIQQIPEEKSIQQFNQLLKLSEQNGFHQYEISNFAAEDKISKHNTGYWTGKKYIGLGPSAHSYNGIERQWNVNGIISYCKKVKAGEEYYEKELIDERTRFNEYLLTSLRTKWGIEVEKVKCDFGNVYLDELLKKTEKHLIHKNLICEKNRIILSGKGMFLADSIIQDLFIC